MFSKLNRLGIAAILACGAALSANAATITPNQELQCDGVTPVWSNRSDIGNISDGDPDTMYSLGCGGSLTVDVSPNRIGEASVVEITGNNDATHPESAQLFLDGVLFAELFTTATGMVAANLNPINGFTVTTTANDGGVGLTGFLIELGTNYASELKLVDTTNPLASTSFDGFDIAELSVAEVPLPAAGLLFISGLLGAGLWRRRKIQKEVGLPSTS